MKDLNRPKKEDYDFNDNIEGVRYAKDMNDYADKLEEQLRLYVVSKSFAVGKVLEIIDNVYGHQFNKGELVRIIRYDSSSAAKWLCTNTRFEYWLSEREANVC